MTNCCGIDFEGERLLGFSTVHRRVGRGMDDHVRPVGRHGLEDGGAIAHVQGLLAQAP